MNNKNQQKTQQNRNPHVMLCPPLAVSSSLLVNLQSNMLVLFIDNEVSNQTHTKITSGCFPVCFGLVSWEEVLGGQCNCWCCSVLY